MTAALSRPHLRLLYAPISVALFAATREQGYQAVAIGDLLVRAGMGEDEFARYFAGKTDLTVKVCEAYAADFEAQVELAFAGHSSWPDNLRAAAYAVARWIRDNPEAAWFGTVGVLEAPDQVLLLREETLKVGLRMIDAGRELAPDPVPAAAPLLVVGAIIETLRRRQEGAKGDGDPVSAVPGLMAAAVRPYLGSEVSNHELEVPLPPDLTAYADGRSTSTIH